MGQLVDDTLNLLMILSAEKIALNENPWDFISVWAEMAEESGQL